MGFVKEQYDEFKAKIDGDSAAYDPNYVIASETAPEGDAPAPEAAQADAPVEPDQSGAPEGYEAQPAPQ
jgi:hypothetical protein